MINVTYKRPYNPYRTYWQSQRRDIGIRSFKDVEAARAFAQTVDVVSVFNNVGKKITL
jgi:hypothetical protein